MGNYLTGFRPGWSTITQIFGLRQLMEKSHKYGIDLYNIFIDFKKVYDSVRHKSVMQAITYFQVPIKLKKLIMETLISTSYKIKNDNKLLQMI